MKIILTKEKYIELIKNLDIINYDYLQLEEFIYEFLSIKANLESLLKIIEIVNISLLISFITSFISNLNLITLFTGIFILSFCFIYILISILLVKKIFINLEHVNLIIERYKEKLYKIKQEIGGD